MEAVESSKQTGDYDTSKLEDSRGRLIDCNGNYCSHNIWKEIFNSDNPEMYMEDLFRNNQARLGSALIRALPWRFQAKHQSCTTISYDKKYGRKHAVKRPKYGRSKMNKYKTLYNPDTKPLMMEKQDSIIKLTDVAIITKAGRQGGEAVIGTLEAHVNGFIFSTNVKYMHFKVSDVNIYLFRVADERMLPLLHFHLHDNVKVGTEKTKDIQFHLMPTPVIQKRPDYDSDVIENEKQTGDRGHNEDLQNFVEKVRAKLNCPFQELEAEWEFHGVLLPSKVSASFVLTPLFLAVLVETPFAVSRLSDIEIVNLSSHIPVEIVMTVIFWDFKADNVLQVSAPLESVARLKEKLNLATVIKYYENKRDLDWKSIVKEITDHPETFIKNDGWEFYELVDSATSAFYVKELILYPDCFSDEED
ncbi:hypothetical protein MKX01_015137 [Papaver californicum]|nr:hypothetical protein MKX01_015137 [Papaver californicum]